MINPVRKALLERRLTLGTWIQAGHPVMAELFSSAGYEWVAADCEHTDIDLGRFTEIARSLHGRKSVPFIRARENDTLAIRQMLDAGAQGVIIPLVNSADEARAAVRAAKYPPAGVRGFAFCRANDWGVHFDEYAAEANENIAVVIMVESRQAVEQIDAILAVDGVDGVFIGPYDLSGSYGLVGQTSHPVVTRACLDVVDACKRHGKSAGLHIVRPTAEAITTAIKDGFTFIALGMDTVFLYEGSRLALENARLAMGTSGSTRTS